MAKQQFLDLNGLTVTVNKLLERIDNCSKVLQYKNLNSFPTVGKENVIYIDQENNKTYRWDDNAIKFYCIGSDFNVDSISLISGGTSTA